MSDIKCVIDGRNQPRPGATICGHCLNRIDDNLARIAELTAWAADFVEKSTAANMAGSAIAAESSLLNLDALDAAAGRTAVRVEGWERMTREHFGYTPWPPRRTAQNAALAAARRARGVRDPEWSVEASVRFLRAQLLRIIEDATYPIEEFAGDVKAIRWGIPAVPDEGIVAQPGLERFAKDRDNAKPGVRVRCPADHPEADGRLCLAWLIVDKERPKEDVVCPRCRTTWTQERLVLVANSVPAAEPIWATGEEVMSWLQLSPRTLSRWVKCGSVERRRTRDGWIYDVQQVHAANRNRSATDQVAVDN